MRVEEIELRLVRMPLVSPFATSFGEEREKEAILVSVQSGDATGWGECVAGNEPGFSEEFNDGVWLALREFLAPTILGAGEIDPAEMPSLFARVRGNRMAKAALEMAALDADLRQRGETLAAYLGGKRDRVKVGVSVGIQDSVERLVSTVGDHVKAGYRRIKLKIRPGYDLDPVSSVRAAFPDIPVSVDANGGYRFPLDVDTFHALDELDLLMIEQPFHQEDLQDHASLQDQIKTPIALDESIRSAADARLALDLGACKIINIKPGRVGGLLEAAKIHDLAQDRRIHVWCGGMLETGLGRAANLALASLPRFTIPGDISASARYFEEDLTEPFTLSADGTIELPKGMGIGVEPLPQRLEEVTVRSERLA
ncbi:MAG: o-succinylbenzoate synthase [Actinomycetota bacterium]